MKKIVSSARRHQCAICKNFFHLLCIPGITKYDDAYSSSNIDWFCPMCNQSILAFNHFTSDNEFIECLSENWMIKVSVSIDELNEKVFIPFEMNADDENHPLHQVDPDVNYFNATGNQVYHSDYYLEDF